LTDADVAGFDAVFYPGGHGPLFDLAEDPSSRALIENFHAAGKPVVAVCHGPCASRHVRDSDGQPLVAGKRVTGFTNEEERAVGRVEVSPFLVEDDLIRLGGHYEKVGKWLPFVIVDGQLITGQNPASAEVAARTLLQQLSGAGVSASARETQRRD
jgi:putative intracellular protease/amidase